MDNQTRTHELFPAVFKRRMVLVWTVVLPVLLLAAIHGFVCWLTWSELKTPKAFFGMKDVLAAPRVVLLSFAMVALVTAAVAGGAVAVLRRRARDVPAWLQVALGGWFGVQFLAFVFSGWMGSVEAVPAWVVRQDTYLLAQLVCVTPGVFLGIWRLAGWPRRGTVPKGWDVASSLLAVVLAPLIMYLSVHVFHKIIDSRSGGIIVTGFVLLFVFLGIWRLAGLKRRGMVSKGWDVASSLLALVLVPLIMYLSVYMFSGVIDSHSEGIIVAGFVLLFVVMFAGLFRLLMWLRVWFVEKARSRRAWRVAYGVLVSLVLPLAGLMLNRAIPFPADLQNVWVYALTVVNAVFLVMPFTGVRVVDAITRAGRLVLFPFTCYFFVVFLPFLPFAIPAILAVGAGFLILTPVLLFAFHLQALADDRRTGGHGAWWRVALCVAVLPVAFAMRAELDRAALHRALDMVYQPDYGQDVRLGMPRSAVRRALVNAQRFKTGAEYPYITLWYNWRVYDNMLLQDAKLNALWMMFVGGKQPPVAEEDMVRDVFSSIWGSRTRDRVRGTRQAIPSHVTLLDVVTAHSVTNGEVATRATLKIRGGGTGQQEYRTTLTVPPGVWVSGLRLKIDGEWVDGDIIERKAADWVYRQITRVTRRDPAMLRYEDDTHLSLCVFPVDAGQTREVEFSFLCPEGYADAVLVGDRRVALGTGTVRPMCVWTDGVLAKNRLWRAPGGDEGAAEKAGNWLVLECSATNGMWSGEALAGAARGLTGAVHVVWANAEIVTETAPAEDIARLRPKLAAVGGVNAEAALRCVARQCRLAGVTRPRVVFAGATARQMCEKMPPETWRGVLAEVPGLREVALAGGTAFPVPGAAAQPVSVLATRHDSRQAVDGRDEVLAFEGDPESLPTLGGAALDGVVRMPPESMWARGAAAWRLQCELDMHPSRGGLRRDILRASLGSDVLTAAGAYIAVENDMQRKMLHLKQVQTLGGSGALDLVESPAPDGWLLLVMFALAWFVGKKLLRRKQSFSKAGAVEL